MLIIQRPEIEAGEAEGNLQRFTIAPLEPGFGHTLGNSLRRTLLSSIPGAAVTQVRFDEALHEFDVIPGVKEDVTDLILNLKDLVLTCSSDEPVTLRLDKRGPGEVTAGDIQTTADVEILNPELHIATVNAKGRLAVRPHRRAGPRLPVGRAQQAHVDDRRHPGRRDLLAGAPGVVLDRADPRRAGHQLRQAHARDRDRRFDHAARRARVGRRHAAQPRGAGRRPGRRAPRPRARRGGAADSTSPDLELAIEELDLSERPRNCLKRARVDTIGQLVQKTEDDLLAITNFGSKSLEEVIAEARRAGPVAAGQGVSDAGPQEGSALRQRPVAPAPDAGEPRRAPLRGRGHHAPPRPRPRRCGPTPRSSSPRRRTAACTSSARSSRRSTTRTSRTSSSPRSGRATPTATAATRGS